MSNRTRQNNKGADRKMESNDSPEITYRGETSEEPGLPSGQKNGRVYGRILKALNIDEFERTIRREIRRRKRNRPIRSHL